MRKIKIAVIGAGSMGAKHIRTCFNSPCLVEVTAIVDPQIPRLPKFHKIVQQGLHFTSIDDCMDRFEAAIVAVPTELHFAVARQLIDAGKHVLVEKPLCHDVPSAKELAKIAGKVCLAVGHVERYNCALRAVRKLLLRPSRLIFTRANHFQLRACGVDVLRDLLIHDVDLAISFDIGTIKGVDVVGDNDTCVDGICDHIDVKLEFERATAYFTASRNAADIRRSVVVESPDKIVTADLVSYEIGVYGAQSESFKLLPTDALTLQLNNFIGAIQGSDSVLVDAKSAIAAMEIVQMIAERTRSCIRTINPVDSENLFTTAVDEL
jgi:predicted dehydrogenase